jgi:hypothetical protein
MNPKYLYTIRWTQPYTGYNPYMKQLWEMYELMIEKRLEEGDFTQAQQEIERIKKL